MVFSKKKFFLGFGAGVLGTLLLLGAGIGITYWYLLNSELPPPAQAPKIDLATLTKLRVVPAGANESESLNLNTDKVYVISFFEPGNNSLIQLPGLNDLKKKLNNKKVAFYFIGGNSEKQIEKVSAKFNGSFPIYRLQDSLPEVYNYYLPKTYIIANNQIVFEHTGSANWNDSTVVNFINRQL